ncbi:MAG: Gfo/Idh/MocA family oxidoreductase [Verrucomicrobia bacterium]|jgi:predicted dehydrogenase|nr:Gfo/Idh/MocA family oxidoreductase [Verrucomicrobiota bacterium]OQC62614.1 MAG: Glycosyl hydrolase family 109 protein 1 precursor [Verrucomicrobia bacterium ADurb.Bin006]MDI9381155.1 Gfo/Idh/MocA family oxidoreductase [Verrucomicrobiota bacterium]HNV00732.1 Gfo/Idh/MocA family oxidoreductase [Verrucomicrobiota bacterium]HOA59828.1 Gfo/Idh/MocA family oxidoreductase [Verrucomicrobiota bacterium]
MINETHRGLTRRQFLARGAAGAAALPCLIPASALGRDGAVAPSERIVMGGIGMGGRGAYDLSVLLGMPDVQWVAVCDVLKRQRQAAKNLVDNKMGNRDCAAYSDMRQFLAERTDVDAVLIATGDRWHALASVLAMRAGKDVYCEKPACLTMAQGQMVAETARRYARVYQTGAQRLSEPHHVFAIEMARSGRLGPIHTAYADCRWRDGLRHDWLPAEAEPSKDELDWDIWLGPCPWRPYNSGYVNGGGWYHFYDFATDVAMWGAHTVAQALAGLDMSGVQSIEFEFAGPDQTMMTRLSNGVKLVLYRVPGSVWEKCEYWHGACGERFDGPEGWVAAADGYSETDVSSPALLREYRKVLADYTARTQRPLNHVRDFIECIRSRRLTVAHHDVMAQSMNICLAADICEQLKRNMTFDLRKAEFVGDAEANRLRSRAMRAPYLF